MNWRVRRCRRCSQEVEMEVEVVAQIGPLSVDEVEEVELVEQNSQLLGVAVHEVQLLGVVHEIHGWWRPSPL